MAEFLKFLGDYKEGIGALQNLLTMVAILLGGAWAYFKFIKGRVFATRLEPHIEGRIVRTADGQFAILTVSIENVGLSRVTLNGEQSTIEVFAYPAENYMPEFHDALLDSLGVTLAVTAHEWIEPGECISEQRIVALPPEPMLALKVHLRILQAGSLVRGVEWNAVAIAAPEAEKPAQAPAGPATAQPVAAAKPSARRLAAKAVKTKPTARKGGAR